MRKQTAGMFQPQSTPLDIFSYGAIPTQNAFEFSSSDSGFALNGGGPIVFDNPTFAAAGDFRSLQANTAQSNVHNLQGTTFGGHHRNTMSSMYEDELAAQQDAARDYAPNLEGPLVGEKKSCLAITDEYAKSDPIYVAKTTALPQTYSHYRPVQGDGSCGWRDVALGIIKGITDSGLTAIAFTYFETLQRIGSKAKLQEELARITSLNNLIQTVGGFSPYVFEDFVEETQNLLKDLAESIHLPPTSLILDRFNNPETSNSIVYHLRLLACSWLRANRHIYSDFIEDGLSVDGYCEQRLQVVNTEIDYTGMTLLIDVLLKPIDIAVEIVYLDRSEGSEVNAHRFEAIDPSSGRALNPDSPTIYLLYKPGHYDILYKDPPTQDLAMHLKEQAVINDASNNQNLQVHRVSSFSQPAFHATATNFAAVTGLDDLLSIPGFAPAPTHHNLPIFSPTPISTFSDSSAFFVKNEPLSATYVPIEPTLSPHPTSLPLHNLNPTHPELSLNNVSSMPMGSPTEQKFRPSCYQYKADYGNSSTITPPSRAILGPAEDDSHQTLSTSMFKNSHFNTAHFNNPNFQPEEWCPPEEGSLDDDD